MKTKLAIHLRISLLSVVCGLWSVPASAQYNYALNYQTNTINVVSNWVGNGTYVIGSNTSFNVLRINSGARLTNSIAYLGMVNGSSNNIAVVSGAGALWSMFTTNYANLMIGTGGAGNQLIVSNGGKVLNGNSHLGFGSISTSNNLAIVTGSGSVWENTGFISLGASGGGGNKLVVTNGGTVISHDYIRIGNFDPNGNNVIEVSGAGSVLTNTGSSGVTLGYVSSGNRLIVTDGGKVSNIQAGRVGLSSSNNLAIVRGPGSTWETDTLIVGEGGGHNNQLVVTNGGAVVNGGGYLGSVGYGTNNNNLVTVTGTGSVWSNTFGLFVGDAVSAGNRLNVTDGGKVYAGVMNVASNNSVTLTSGRMDIFHNLTNSGTVSGAGTITAYRLVNHGTMMATNGELRLDAVVSGGGSYRAVSGSSTTGTLTFVRGGSVSALYNTNATLRFTRSEDNYYLVGPTLTNTSAFVNMGTMWFDGGNYYSSGIVSNPFGSHLIFNGGTITAPLVDLGGTNITANTTVTSDSLGGLDMYVQSGVTVSTSGSFTNSGAISLIGGTLTGASLVNNTNGVLAGKGTATFGSLTNAGQIFFNGATMTVTGAVNNSGTFTSLHSVNKFSGPVVFSGAWITDPTTNIFNNNFITTESGYINALDDLYIFTNDNSTAGHFINRSTNSAAFNTADAKFLFSGTLAVTQNLYAAGLNREPLSPSLGLTDLVSGDWNAATFTNFSLGTLEISNFSTVRVWDAFSGLGGQFGANDGLKAALYVDSLLLGLNSYLIIGDNVELYFRNSNSWSSANYTLVGSGQLHQFNNIASVVPEPNVALLWVAGAATAYTARRRQRRKTRAEVGMDRRAVRSVNLAERPAVAPYQAASGTDAATPPRRRRRHKTKRSSGSWQTLRAIGQKFFWVAPSSPDHVRPVESPKRRRRRAKVP